MNELWGTFVVPPSPPENPITQLPANFLFFRDGRRDQAVRGYLWYQ